METEDLKPIRWNDDRPRQAFELALLGATDKEIARVMGVAEHTVEYWKQTKPEFLEALNMGKLEADAKVAASLYMRAVGFRKKVKHIVAYKGDIQIVELDVDVDPDPWSAMKWLGIRQRSKWADVQKTELTQTNINVNTFDFTGMDDEELKVLKKIGMKQVTKQLNGN